MTQKLKNIASKLRNKIGGDELDQKLASAVSDQNWHASTRLFHEITNSSYNYEKWQKINDFIWGKLNKSKNWKKILKTLNLIEFLLKNGPSSGVSAFKHQLYHLQRFESYSTFSDGLDKGQPIRQRAKILIKLLSNTELLEEQRIKAKNIREKMATVVYSRYKDNNSSGLSESAANSFSGKYESYDSKKNKPDANQLNYGHNVGTYGKSTSNKVNLYLQRETKDQKSQEASYYQTKYQQDKIPTVIPDTKKPFEKIANKLQKPQAIKEQRLEEVCQIDKHTIKINQNLDILPISQPSQVRANQGHNEQAFVNVFQLIGETEKKQSIDKNQHLNSEHANKNFQNQHHYIENSNNIGNQNQSMFINQLVNANQYQPSSYQQYNQSNQFNQQTYNQAFFPQHNENMSINSHYAPAFHGVNSMVQPINYMNPMYPPVSDFNNQQNMISLKNRSQAELMNSQSLKSTINNANWLSNNEKGLIDFSDFSNQIKKSEGKRQPSTQINNKIDTTWNW